MCVGAEVSLSPQGCDVDDDYNWDTDPLRPGEVGVIRRSSGADGSWECETQEDGHQVLVKGPRGQSDWYAVDHVVPAAQRSAAGLNVSATAFVPKSPPTLGGGDGYVVVSKDALAGAGLDDPAVMSASLSASHASAAVFSDPAVMSAVPAR